MKIKELSKKILQGNFSFLSLFKTNKTEALHPAEMAKILVSLPNDAVLRAFEQLPQNMQVSVFAYMDEQHQKFVIKNVPDTIAAVILNGLYSDDRMSFLSEFEGDELEHYINLLDEKSRKAAHDLLGYPDSTVARLINTDVAAIKKGMTIEEAMDYLRKTHKDTEAANVIYVVDDEGRLVDDIPVRRLVLNDPTLKIEDILDGSYEALNIKDKRETAVDKFKEYDRIALPVINDENMLLGVITIDDVIDIAEQEDTEDIQKFGGMESLDYPYVKTPVLTLIQKRAGWLIILFISEMLTATAMQHFDVEIAKAAVLAMFVPLVISSGGNGGSQAATLIIRAMALKELNLKSWFYVMRRELLSGLALGLILGCIGFLRILLWQKLHIYDYGEYWMSLGFTVFFSLIGIIMWGTLSGSMIPMVLKRFKLDPATSSAPFVATLVDVTGLIIYFTIAAILLKGKLL
ncbi:MAG TPA: magnesium transporter [Chitinophagaceae bacterium]|nr:magnesium transporter [Chitinophagaceae bacterium]